MSSSRVSTSSRSTSAGSSPRSNTSSWSLAILGGLLLVACSGSTKEDSTASLPESPSGSWFIENLPLGSLQQRVVDVLRLAEEQVQPEIVSCMAALDFEYTVQIPPVTTLRFLRYGLLDSDPPQYTSFQDDEDEGVAEAEPPPGMEEEYGVALLGAEGLTDENRTWITDETGRRVGFTFVRGGCLGAAQRKVFSDDKTYHEYAGMTLLTQVLFAEATDAMWERDDMQSAIAPFADCMSELGHERPTRLDHYYRTEWYGQPEEAQRNTAEAEMSCKSRSVLEAAYQIDWQMQKRFALENAELLGDLGHWEDLLSRGSADDES